MLAMLLNASNGKNHDGAFFGCFGSFNGAEFIEPQAVLFLQICHNRKGVPA
jgi:hypothetical protein